MHSVSLDALAERADSQNTESERRDKARSAYPVLVLRGGVLDEAATAKAISRELRPGALIDGMVVKAFDEVFPEHTPERGLWCPFYGRPQDETPLAQFYASMPDEGLLLLGLSRIHPLTREEMAAPGLATVRAYVRKLSRGKIPELLEELHEEYLPSLTDAKRREALQQFEVPEVQAPRSGFDLAWHKSPPPSTPVQLSSLLSKFFAVWEMRRFLRYELAPYGIPEGPRLSAGVSWDGSSRNSAAEQVAELLERNGLVDRRLHAALMQARGRGANIALINECFAALGVDITRI